MKKKIQTIKELKEQQGKEGTIDQGPYMVGLYNGLELALATLENRSPEFYDVEEGK